MRRRFCRPFSAVREGLARALERQGLKVVAQLPTTEILAKAGFSVPGVHQVFFFDPPFMSAVILGGVKRAGAATEGAIMRAPLKAVVLEEGEETVVDVQDPVEVFRDRTDLAALAADMEKKVGLALEEAGGFR